MPNTYYVAQGLDGEQIEAALTAIDGVVTQENNGKILAIEDGVIVAKSASEWTDTPVLQPLSATANGDYVPESGVDGFNSVHVAVPGAGNIQPLSVTQNGTYNPPSGVDGYAPVTVNVSGGGVDATALNYSVNSGPVKFENGYIAGPFTSGSYYIKPLDTANNKLTINWSQPFKIHLRVRVSQSYSGVMAFCGGVERINSLPGIDIESNNSGILFGISYDGNVWSDETIFIPSSEMAIVVGTWLELTSEYDGTKFTATMSDGANTVTHSTTPSSPLYNNSNYTFEVGGIFASSSFCARYGQIDLSNTYIESNGVLVWGCRSSV